MREEDPIYHLPPFQCGKLVSQEQYLQGIDSVADKNHQESIELQLGIGETNSPGSNLFPKRKIKKSKVVINHTDNMLGYFEQCSKIQPYIEGYIE